MVELDAFEAPDFDPVTYVNDYCQKKSQDAPMDRYLTELELRLQLVSEDIVGKLADASSRASLRVPSALKELLNIQARRQSSRSDLASAQASMAEVQERVNASAVGPGAQAVDTLRQLERVKGRMQTAADTLEVGAGAGGEGHARETDLASHGPQPCTMDEASGLASLFHRMDSLFADEDLPAIAAALAGMQRGLRVVGDSVPGFADGPARLATFQARLRDLVRAPLVAALQNRQGGEAQQLAGMLEGAGDGASLERLYCAAVLPPLRAAWEQVDPARAPFVSALPQFFEQVLGLLRGEAGWLAEAMPCPGEYLLLLPQLLEAVLLRDEESAGAEDALASVNEWTSRVATASTQELTQRLRQLPRLTRGGAGQLAADLEYFCNVLSTLGMEAPDALAGWAAGAAVQGEEPGEAAGDARAAFGELLAAAEGKEGRDAVRAVAALRGIQL
ncbi:hypothetical protein APUTEX25_004874 [Auxenochlorella protothecoides]|uniref:Conserved oligomeric Golgi complex subunit 7 n=1 Tax=Auxenochlorella protothecoides TaxID=3075 RepID=A0A3M7KW75_AUXPR|nr:hypothetical protein APUTEX25_004874 [Auxenochlorella protothecoides]|eukprot:RMZ53386.1 hypothetical protein APUTEX25_004874 [Auxenochlorella protothecoides]